LLVSTQTGNIMIRDALSIQKQLTGNAEDLYSRFAPSALQARCAGLFTSVKEYF